MKKKILICSIILILIIVAVVFIIIKNKDKGGFKIDFTANNKKIHVGEEVVLQIKTNEQILATNFELVYDNEAFELVGSETNNLMVAKKNGKIACIYSDLSGQGTNEFKIKLKATKESKAEFKIEGAKFRGVGKETSYVQDQINGINKNLKIEVKK